tara:strand:+ start:3115 stop:3735 length:621 start_codon:yes stop_codon:yes gene_type:complete
MKLTEAFSPEESKKIYDNFLAIIGTRRDKLVKRYGAEAEKVAYAKAVKQVKKQALEKTEEEPMDKTEKLKEMVKDALTRKPVKEDDGISAGIKNIENEPISEEGTCGHNPKTTSLSERIFAKLREMTPSQQKYVDMAASKPSKPKKTQFRKDIEGAKRMIDAGRAEDEVIKKYGIEAFNAVNAENEYLEESKHKELAEAIFNKLKK